MRICFLGDTGDSKTLSAIALLLEYYHKGFKVYSNINLKEDLKDYIHISNTNFINIIDENIKNIVLMDEIGRTTYEKGTHNAVKFGDLVTQSRKSIGEDSHLLFTAQIEKQLTETLKQLSDYLIYPRVLIRIKDLYPNTTGLKKNMPLVVQWNIKEKMRSKEGIVYFKTRRIPYYPKINFPLVTKCYNTFQMVNRIGDGMYLELKKKYPSFINTKGKLKELKVILQFKESLNIAESDRIARAIILNLEED